MHDAREESFDMIYELCDLKKKGSIKKIIVCGCLPQKYPEGFDEECMQEIDGYVGTGEIDKIVDVVKSAAKDIFVKAVKDLSYIYSHNTPRFFLTPSYVKYIKIAEGCNNRCSFCIIPDLRGPYRSRPIESIVAEVKQLVGAGMREAVLISQDTSYYGKDLYGKLTLSDLLYELEKIEGLKWIRLLYLYPQNITDDLIETIKNSSKVCHYLDISLQHINNDILKSMRRFISREKITDILKKLRAEIPDMILRTTFIVGYPGERFAEFNELLDFVSDMKFDKMGAFMYSEEEGSPAAQFEDDVSEVVKKDRFQDIMLLQQKISRKKNQSYKGRVFEVVIEGVLQDRPEYFIGRSYMDAPEIDGFTYVKKEDGIEIGEFYPVRITNTEEYDLIGEVVWD